MWKKVSPFAMLWIAYALSQDFMNQTPERQNEIMDEFIDSMMGNESDSR